MPKDSKPYFTRSVSKRFYGGTPIETLPTDLCTYRSIIRFSYFAQFQLKFVDILERAGYISTELKKQWGKVNSELPLISDYSATLRVKRLLERVNCINHKKGSQRAVKVMDEKLDTLFNVCACNCECSDREVNRKLKNCPSIHIVSQCNKENRVPVEERNYMEDQKEKTGQKEAFQMGSKVLTKKTNSETEASNASDPTCEIDIADKEGSISFSKDKVSNVSSRLITYKLFYQLVIQILT